MKTKYVGVKLLKSYDKPFENMSMAKYFEESQVTYFFSNSLNLELEYGEYVVAETRKGLAIGTVVELVDTMTEDLKLVPLKAVVGVVESEYFDARKNERSQTIKQNILRAEMKRIKATVTFKDEVARYAELSPEFKALVEELGLDE